MGEHKDAKIAVAGKYTWGLDLSGLNGNVTAGGMDGAGGRGEENADTLRYKTPPLIAGRRVRRTSPLSCRPCRR